MAVPVVAAESTGSGTSSAVVTKPTGTASGDLLIAYALIQSYSAISWTTPSGWTELDSYDYPSYGSIPSKQVVLAKIAGGSEPASYTFTSSGAAYCGAQIARVTGAAGTVPTIKAKIALSSGGFISFPSVTTTVADTLILLFGWATSDVGSSTGTWANSTPSGTTRLAQPATGSTWGGAKFTQAATGATGVKSIDTPNFVNDANSRSVGFTIAVAPGGSGPSPISGSAAATLGALISTATGKLALAGAVSQSLAAVTSSTTGALRLSGSSSITLGALTFSATGARTPVSAAVAISFSELTGSSAGALPIRGAASTSLGPLTGAGAGASAISGSAAGLMASLTSLASGSLSIAGTSALALSPLTGSSAAVLPIAGDGSALLDGMTVLATGALSIKATATLALGALNALGTGHIAEEGSGTADALLGSLSVTGAGNLSIFATAAVALGGLTGASQGVLPLTGAGTGGLDPLMASATGNLSLTGAASMSLGTLDASAFGALAIRGALTALLDGLGLVAAGQNRPDVVTPPERRIVVPFVPRSVATAPQTSRSFAAPARPRLVIAR